MTTAFWINNDGLFEKCTEEDRMNQGWIKVINDKSFLFGKYTPSVKSRIESYVVENKQLFKNKGSNPTMIELCVFESCGNMTKFFTVDEINENGLPDYLFQVQA